ncbi:hypothetical protein OH779_32105 [Actinacidiphila glaucinigra]
MTTDTATDSSVNNPVDLNITGLVDAPSLSALGETSRFAGLA